MGVTGQLDDAAMADDTTSASKQRRDTRRRAAQKRPGAKGPRNRSDAPALPANARADRSAAPVRFTTDPLGGLDLENLPEALRAHVVAARELAERALADSTRRSYRNAWNRWERWCAGHGFDPRSGDPELLLLWIVEMTTTTSEDGELEPGRVRPVSLAPTIAAIDRAAKADGLAPPSHDPAVQVVLSGIRRSFGMAPTNARHALELEMLLEVLKRVDAPPAPRIRDAVAVALRGAGLSLGECSGRGANGLRWGQVQLQVDSAVVEVRSARGNRSRSVRLEGTDTRWLKLGRGLEAGDQVLDLSRQGIADAVTRSMELGGVRADADLGDLAVRERIYAALGTPTNTQLRDRAVLLIGWWSALRRSNLEALVWDDITPVVGGIEISVRRSKTDQEGHGEVIFVPAAGDSGLPCPVEALLAYGERLAEETGTHPAGSELPLLAAVDRHDHFVGGPAGAPWSGMSGAAIHELVRRSVAAAGGDPEHFGAHSLRAGFITSAFDMGIPAADIAKTSLHASVDVLLRYNRPSDRRRRSAAGQMHAVRAQAENEPTLPAAAPEGPPTAFMP
jgi:hypothetical protein